MSKQRPRTRKPNGVILWEGPSRLDGAPIVVIATGLRKRSGNTKTGAMVQTWILRADVEPRDAVRTGADASICGDCPHRHHTGGACYVRVNQAPLQVYRAYKRGSYPRATPDALTGRVVRFGAYGDPAAAPRALWAYCAKVATRWTGYTHQWRRPDVDLRGLVMASADSLSDAYAASRLGYRTFRVAPAPMSYHARETLCPASKEAGQKTTCANCTLCNGATGPLDRRRSVAIQVHGTFKSRLRVVS